jgi:toxin ParE1/3/4
MANVKIAEVVRFDLVEIWKFIADDNPTAATETIEAIERKFNLLATQPEMGRNRSDLLKGLQTHPIGNYTIWVFATPKPQGVEIVRVLESHRSIDESYFSE